LIDNKSNGKERVVEQVKMTIVGMKARRERVNEKGLVKFRPYFLRLKE
jgi:hypothetical protein